MPDDTPHSTTVDVPLRGGENLDFGDVRIKCLATPGHTPGSICYLLERRNLRALFAGDVIMMLRGDDIPRSELGNRWALTQRTSHPVTGETPGIRLTHYGAYAPCQSPTWCCLGIQAPT
jgi:hypothetical protein